MNHRDLPAYIWLAVDPLRSDYSNWDTAPIIWSFANPKYLGCALQATKATVLTASPDKPSAKLNPDLFLLGKSVQTYHSKFGIDLTKFPEDIDHTRQKLFHYVQALDPADFVDPVMEAA